MKKILSIIFLLISTATFAQIKVLKVIGQPGIAKADSVNGYVTPTQLARKQNVITNLSDTSKYAKKATTLSGYGITDAYPLSGNPSGFLTSASITGKINYTDSSSMLSPYLRKVDTTGKWISPAVANATYATISNLNLKANDNNVIHPTGNETANSKWARNSYVAIGGESIDLGMTGLYDRNELTNANLRGTVTDTLTSGGVKTTGYDPNLLFDGSAAFFNVPAVNGSNDSLVVVIDLGANVNNYSHAEWQPFVSYRLAADYYKNIYVQISQDNSTWYQPTGWSWDYATSGFFPAACWMGVEAYPGTSTWRYARFVFKNPNSADNYVFISEIGIRHVSAPYARQYLLKAGDNIYGTINLMNKSTNMGSINSSTGTFTGIFSGNSSTATKLQTPRNINGVPFDGTANITVTDATKEPTITAGTTSQYWRGDKTWQSFSTLPVSTATQTALNAKLDTSYRDTWGAADPFVSDTTNKILGMRQSWVDSIRNSSFGSGLSWSLTGNNDSYAKNKFIGYTIADSLLFKVSGEISGFISSTTSNTGFGNGSFDDGTGHLKRGQFNTWLGTSAGAGYNYSSSSVYIGESAKASKDSANNVIVIGDAATATKDNQSVIGNANTTETKLYGLIKSNNDTLSTFNNVRALAQEIVNNTLDLKNKDYPNDSVAFISGNIGLGKFYRTGNIVKVVSTLPVGNGLYFIIKTGGGNADSVSINLDGFGETFTTNINWGDGSTQTGIANGTDLTHKYTTAGNYLISFTPSVYSNVRQIHINEVTDSLNLLSVGNLDNFTNLYSIVCFGKSSTWTDTLTFPSTVRNIQLSASDITEFSNTKLPNITNFEISNTSCKTISYLPSTITTLTVKYNNWSQADLNNFLVWLDAQTFNAGAKTADLRQANGIVPSGAGLTAKTSLQGKGWTITTD